jgi:hypothetical protein
MGGGVDCGEDGGDGVVDRYAGAIVGCHRRVDSSPRGGSDSGEFRFI